MSHAMRGPRQFERRAPSARLRLWVVGFGGGALGALLGCTESGRTGTSPGAQRPSAAAPSGIDATSSPAPSNATGASSSTPASVRPPKEQPRSCALGLKRAGKDRFAVSVVIQNMTDQPMVARYDHPLLFALEAWAGTERVQVEIPPYDGPAEPRTVSVPARQRVEVPTPVTIRFAPDGQPPSNSPFDWLLLSPRTDLRLKAKRALSDTPELSCELQFNPR